MIPWSCNIHNHFNWFLLDRYIDIRTVAYLQTVCLISQVFSSSINSLKILGVFVTSRQILISRLDRTHFNNP